MSERSGLDSRVERTEFMRTVQAVAVMLMVGLIVGALYVLRDILMPLALALLLSFVLAPVVKALCKLKLPRAVAVPVVVLAAFMGLFALGALFASQVTQFAGELPTYQTNLRDKLSALRGAARSDSSIGRASDILQDLASELNGEKTTATPAPQIGPAAGPKPQQSPIPVEVHERKGPLQTLAAMISPLLHPLAVTAMIVIFVMFILAQREDLRNRFIKLAGARDLHRTTAALDDAAKRLSRLYSAQLALNASFGAFIGVGLWLIGIPNPILWGLLAGVLRFVP